MSRDPVQALTMLQALASALNIRAIYPAEHPRVQESVTRLVSALAACLREREATEITLLILDQELLVDERPLRAHAGQLRTLVRGLNRLGVERLTLAAGLAADEGRELVGYLAGGAAIPTTPHVVLGRVVVQETAVASADAGGLGAGGGTSNTAEISEGDVDRAERQFLRFPTDGQGSIEQLDQVLWHFVEGLEHTSRTLLLLAPQTTSDQRLFAHSLNVSLLTLAQARAVGIAGQTLHDIGLAALLHDIGKLSLPQSLFEQTEPLNEREWEIVRQHPELGAAQLCGISTAPPIAALVAYEHHLRWDGEPSFPRPTVPRKPNLASQLTAIADTYDTMVASRGIVGGPRGEIAMKVWRERAGSYLDPFLVGNFVTLMRGIEAP
jgi:putative nucleotidyltransferase with HDIG domain